MDEKHYEEIIALLKNSQKELTIKEISQELSLNRMTTTKYLNSLFATGRVNMRKVGPAKMYSLAIRLPFDQILSRLSDLILILDDAYTTLNVSDSFLRVFGVDIDHIKNLNINSTVIGPMLIDRIRDSVKQGMVGKEGAANVWIPVQKEWRAFRIRVIPLVFGWADKGIAVMLEDRTDEILAQEENALLADLVNASPAAITVTDFEGNYLYSNQKNLDLHGYSLKEFLTLNIKDIDTPETVALLDGRLDDVKKFDEITFEVVHIRKDGWQIPLEVHSKVARWGDLDVIFSIATDISERKLAEYAFKESERKFAHILDFLPDATVVLDNNGTIIAWNRALEDLTGVKACDVLGRGRDALATAVYGETRPVLIDLILDDDLEVRKHYQNVTKKDDTFTAETVLTIPGNGERVVWLKASPFYGKDGRITGTIESIRDITELQRLKKKLQ